MNAALSTGAGLAGVAPSRGVPIGELIPATIVAGVLVLAVVALGAFHRRGLFGGLDALGRRAERISGLPGWAGVPIAVGGVSLVTAAFGYYWDVSWHIDRGRDPGPFANPAHWFIIVGLQGIAFAGVLSMLMGDRKATEASVALRPRWHAPVGGVLLAICGVVALAGFPLDDVWHRLFGQDVTAWGPTHIQMIGGASLSTLAMWMLLVEGRRAAAAAGRAVSPVAGRLADLSLGGAFLIGLSTLQVEFDFGVPQFRLLEQPILVMLAAAIGLVAVRSRGRAGDALGAVAFFLAFRLGLSVLIHDGLGRSAVHFPLYAVEAVLVELVALRVPVRRQLTFGAAAGAAIGTVGLAAEWAWTRAYMPIPWGWALWPAGAIAGLVAAVAGGVIGGLIGRALTDTERQPSPRGLIPLAWIAAVGCIAIALPMRVGDVSGTIDLEDAAGPGGRWAVVTVRLDPPDAAADASWFNVLSWQGAGSGDGGLVMADLEPTGDGTYVSDRAVPMYGAWKTIVRLHTGTQLEALPVYLPEDPAIPAEGVVAQSGSTAAFEADKAILQREATGGSIWLQRGAYAVLLGIAAGWLATLAWGLRRLETHRGPTSGADRQRQARRLAGRPAPARA